MEYETETKTIMNIFRREKTRTARKVPVVYSPRYNAGFLAGQQLIAGFNGGRGGQTHDMLVADRVFHTAQITPPDAPSLEALRAVHSAAYLDSLKSAATLAQVFDSAALAKMPGFIAYNTVMSPMLHQTAGTVTAAQMALNYGWAINLGGGMNRAGPDQGRDCCPLDDPAIAITKLRADNPHIRNIMIIDLNAAAGTGYRQSLADDPDLYVIDFHNPALTTTPAGQIKKGHSEAIDSATSGTAYLQKLSTAFNKAAATFKPDMIFYLGGTDILAGDRRGGLQIDRDTIVKRDEMVFEFAFNNQIPVVMMLGSGTGAKQARLAADSIGNLNRRFGLIRYTP